MAAGIKKVRAQGTEIQTMPLNRMIGETGYAGLAVQDDGTDVAYLLWDFDNDNFGVVGDLALGTFTSQSQTGAANDASRFTISRTTGYTGNGGLATFENLAAAVYSTVNVGAAQYESALLVDMINKADGTTQNTALRIRIDKQASGSSWGAAWEVSDTSGAANPTKGLILSEGVLAANGTDNNGNRIGYEVIAARPFFGTGDDRDYDGTAATIGAGIRLVRQIADSSTDNKFTNGIVFGSAAITTTFDKGINMLYGTFTGPAIHLPTAASIALDTAGSYTLDYAGGSVNLRSSGSPFWQVTPGGITNQQGVLQIGGAQILTSRRPGWGAASGTATRTTFDTATVTTAQLAERFKALVDDLIAGTGHGLIGA